MELSCTYSKRGERVDDEQKIAENSDPLHRQQCYGQFLVDDSFMVPTRYTVHEHVNWELHWGNYSYLQSHMGWNSWVAHGILGLYGSYFQAHLYFIFHKHECFFNPHPHKRICLKFSKDQVTYLHVCITRLLDRQCVCIILDSYVWLQKTNLGHSLDVWP